MEFIKTRLPYIYSDVVLQQLMVLLIAWQESAR